MRADRAIELIGEAGLSLLPPESGHVVALERLPRPPQADPFDRMQAAAVGMWPLTRDVALTA